MNERKYGDLPGAEFVLLGIQDLQQRKETEASLLVAIGTTRLRAAGLAIPMRPDTSELPERQLYRLLAKKYGDEAHARYNSLVRRLISFERALEVRRSHQKEHFPQLLS